MAFPFLFLNIISEVDVIRRWSIYRALFSSINDVSVTYKQLAVSSPAISQTPQKAIICLVQWSDACSNLARYLTTWHFVTYGFRFFQPAIDMYSFLMQPTANQSSNNRSLVKNRWWIYHSNQKYRIGCKLSGWKIYPENIHIFVCKTQQAKKSAFYRCSKEPSIYCAKGEKWRPRIAKWVPITSLFTIVQFIGGPYRQNRYWLREELVILTILIVALVKLYRSYTRPVYARVQIATDM